MNNFEAYSRYYEALYKDKDYEQEAAYVTGLVRAHAPNASKLLELGSGTGKHAEYFSRDGFLIAGLERSSEMVAIAKQKNIKNSNPLVADIVDFHLAEKFNVAVSLFHVVSYLTTNEMLLSCFKSTAGHLEQGGLFLFDVWYSPAVYHQQPETRIKRLSSDGISITRLAEPVIRANENIVEVHYEVIVKDKTTGNTEVLTEEHPMRHFSWPEIDLLARLSGFTILRAEEFGSGKEPGKDTWGVCFLLQKN